MAGLKIRQLGAYARAITAAAQSKLYQAPGIRITGVSSQNWPSAGHPVQPIGPPGSQPLGFPFQFNQNFQFSPRFDAPLTAKDLRFLATYPLGRICVENVKDQLTQLDWKIELRAMEGETPDEIRDRRRRETRGDPMIKRLSAFFENPNTDQDWSEWLRLILDDLLVLDAPSILIRQKFNGELVELRHTPGDFIVRYIDDQGYTPKPPDPAYAQLWEGVPRVALTTDQLMYRPRNITPRNFVASYLYGYSPIEQVAREIEIGMARLMFVYEYYKSGSLPNFIQVVPSKVTPDVMKEAMDFVNSELSGNLAERRQFRTIQGFTDDGKDQIIFPKEPVLADVFDDLHIRKICFALGTAPQRLMRMMNRASAQTSQQSAEDEGIRPYQQWIERSLINRIIRRITGNSKYQMVIQLDQERDQLKQEKISQIRIAGGKVSINEERAMDGLEMSTEEGADQLAITTANGRIPIGMLPPAGPVARGDNPSPKPTTKPNGKAQVV